MEWIRHAENHPEWAVLAGDHCSDAPFSMPTSGYIGFLWDDSFRPGHRHSGLDIFGGTKNGITPIYAAYDGYLTRQSDWKSTVIIRIPSNPLHFPPGTSEVFVKAGTLLGYQGNFSGSPGNPTGVHLHFSIIEDDGDGQFLNETMIENTLDPSPYFNIMLDANQSPPEIPICP